MTEIDATLRRLRYSAIYTEAGKPLDLRFSLKLLFSGFF